MDREFAQVVYRALMLICRYLEERFGFGNHKARDETHRGRDTAA